MRYILLLFLFASLSANASTSSIQNVSVRIMLSDCRMKDYSYGPYDDSIAIYRAVNNSIVIARRLRAFENDGIFSLPLGTYKAVFANKFGQWADTVFSLTDTSQHELKICIDRASAYPLNSLSALAGSDSILIEWTSTGCFHFINRLMVIKKQNNQLSAQLYSVAPPFYDNNKTAAFTREKLLAGTDMNEKKIVAFRRFENELSLVDSGGCTTTDNYNIISKAEQHRFSDGSCQWNGFHFLLDTLFPKISEEDKED